MAAARAARAGHDLQRPGDQRGDRPGARDRSRGEGMAGRVGLAIAGVVLNGAATAAYIGVHFGPGPRDGLMTGLVRVTGGSVRLVRTASRSRSWPSASCWADAGRDHRALRAGDRPAHAALPAARQRPHRRQGRSITTPTGNLSQRADASLLGSECARIIGVVRCANDPDVAHAGRDTVADGLGFARCGGCALLVPNAAHGADDAALDALRRTLDVEFVNPEVNGSAGVYVGIRLARRRCTPITRRSRARWRRTRSCSRAPRCRDLWIRRAAETRALAAGPLGRTAC